jgi:hypothetical protein
MPTPPQVDSHRSSSFPSVKPSTAITAKSTSEQPLRTFGGQTGRRIAMATSAATAAASGAALGLLRRRYSAIEGIPLADVQHLGQAAGMRVIHPADTSATPGAAAMDTERHHDSAVSRA